MTFKEMKRYSSAIASIKYQCKNCGRKMVIINKVDKTICDHCGHLVYKNEEAEFKDKLKKQLYVLKRNENGIYFNSDEQKHENSINVLESKKTSENM